MDRCKSCGQEIMWGLTTNGKPVPLNPKPLNVFVLLNADKNIYSLEKGYETHFSNCADAKKFRKLPDEIAPSEFTEVNLDDE